MARKLCKITEIPIRHTCRVNDVEGKKRLRMFDLGFFQGSGVLPMYECAGGGTRVYYVKDTLIALRNIDGENIWAEEDEEDGR